MCKTHNPWCFLIMKILYLVDGHHMIVFLFCRSTAPKEVESKTKKQVIPPFYPA